MPFNECTKKTRTFNGVFLSDRKNGERKDVDAKGTKHEGVKEDRHLFPKGFSVVVVIVV